MNRSLTVRQVFTKLQKCHTKMSSSWFIILIFVKTSFFKDFFVKKPVRSTFMKLGKRVISYKTIFMQISKAILYKSKFTAEFAIFSINGCWYRGRWQTHCLLINKRVHRKFQYILTLCWIFWLSWFGAFLKMHYLLHRLRYSRWFVVYGKLPNLGKFAKYAFQVLVWLFNYLGFFYHLCWTKYNHSLD